MQRTMSHKTRMLLMELADLIVVIASFIYAFAILPPNVARVAALLFTDWQYAITCGYVCSLLFCIPILTAAIIAAKIFIEIGQDRPFTQDNAERLRAVANLALVEGVLILAAAIIGSIILGSIMFSPLMAVLVCLMFSIGANALAHLTLKAAAIQEENDLTV